MIERFDDIRILSFKLPDFENLTINQKLYIYYLCQAALCGRDILWDQNNRYNLKIRSLLEKIYLTYNGNRNTNEFKTFHTYLKKVWFANGIHHHYSMDKFTPIISRDAFTELIRQSDVTSYDEELLDVIFNPALEPKRVSLNSDSDMLAASSMNYYRDVTQTEAETFYQQMREKTGKNTPSFGLNSQLIKENGQLKELVWKADGKYGRAIKAIICRLEQAIPYAENDAQKQLIRLLISYYESGDLHIFDTFNIEWVKESEGQVDFINGFTEVYGDPLGIKGSWEAIVNYKDIESSKRATILSDNALWFEQHSPVDEAFKKKDVRGVSAKVINVVTLGGDCYPATPIGINLPNSEWIREAYGSKSVTIENITKAYFLDSLNNGMIEEFAFSEKEIQRAKEFGYLGGNLHTDLHECLGHGSGKVNPGVGHMNLKNYYSTIEETRADLFALYFIADKKMEELELVPSDQTAYAGYDAYIRSGLITQLTRIKPGNNIEESHMRNRQLICKWVYEQGKSDNVVEFISGNGKTYVKINDYNKLRYLFGKLLIEIQRIKSEGDFEAAQYLVETYGVKVDSRLHAEVLARFGKLDIASYTGFVNSRLTLAKDKNGEVIDVKVDYSIDYTDQMLEYSANFGFLVE